METASAQGATQITSFTFPHIGNVGTSDEDVEEIGQNDAVSKPV
jgi:carbamoylphosphate synthase small subunit